MNKIGQLMVAAIRILCKASAANSTTACLIPQEAIWITPIRTRDAAIAAIEPMLSSIHDLKGLFSFWST
jgi:hypothetical protein